MKRCVLEYSRGLFHKTVHNLEGVTSIGRSPRNTISLPEPGVSRSHAQLMRSEDRWILQDLQSRNGTFVNDQRINIHTLQHGDRVRVGPVTFLFLDMDLREEKSLSLTETSEAPPEESMEIHDQLDLVRTFLDALPVGVAILNDRMEALYYNRILSRSPTGDSFPSDRPLGSVLQCTRCSGEGICDITAPGSPCALHAALVKAIDEGDPTLNAEVPWPGGAASSPAHIRFSMQPLPYSLAGEPLALLTLEDITERKRTERILRESALLSAVLDGNPLPTFVIDPDQRVVLWNRALESLSGVPRERVTGVPLDEEPSLRDRDWPRVANWILETGGEGQNTLLEGRGLSPSSFIPEAFETTIHENVGGVQRHLNLHAALLRDSEGTIMGAIQTLQDITEREQLQRQLQQAQKMQAIGTLAGGVAHEFNNILAAIQGYTQLIGMRVGEESPLREYVHEVGNSCQRAAGLVRKILTFSRMDASERVLVKPNQMVEDVTKLLRQTLPPDIAIDLDLQAGLPFVSAEPAQIEQLLLNLGVNARDAMPQGGTLAVRTRLLRVDEPFSRSNLWATCASYVEVVMEDTGMGMPPEVLIRAFEPFFTTKDPGKGTGLGLSIAYSIAKSHGGHIEAQSPVVQGGGGSRLRVYLPVAGGEQDSVGSPSLGVLEGPTCRQGERILVVDDEARIREIARDALEQCGYRVVLASDGQEGLRLYREAAAKSDGFSLVILDLAMPVKGGEWCMARILELDPGAAVLVATGYGEAHMDSTLVREKARGILPKPFDLHHLLREVRGALARSR
jgi:signal transduction histidine kinase/pSer/pThr/pTyr-binding forkhead associated (FHA) protein/ActR/RegA family two-component response regulator